MILLGVIQMDMNSAALSQYERQQEEANRVYKTFCEEATEEIIDDLMCGRKVSHWRLADFLENEDFSEAVARLIQSDTDTRITIIDELRVRAEALVRKWVAESDAGQAIVSDRVWEFQEEA